MSLTRKPKLELLVALDSHQNLRRLFLVCTLAVIAFCLFSVSTQAQSLSLGTFTANGSPGPCGNGAGFYYYVYPSTGLSLDMTC
jgi:hypothetical protein